jgi:hypothetical protein
VTLAAVSLTSGSQADSITLGQYLDGRAQTPWPHGFESVARYEAAWATGTLTTHYVKDAEIVRRVRKVAGGAAGGRTRSKRRAGDAGAVLIAGVGRKVKAHVFDLASAYYSDTSLFRVLPRAVAKSFRGVSTPYHYIKAGPVTPISSLLVSPVPPWLPLAEHAPVHDSMLLTNISMVLAAFARRRAASPAMRSSCSSIPCPSSCRVRISSNRSHSLLCIPPPPPLSSSTRPPAVRCPRAQQHTEGER